MPSSLVACSQHSTLLTPVFNFFIPPSPTLYFLPRKSHLAAGCARRAEKQLLMAEGSGGFLLCKTWSLKGLVPLGKAGQGDVYVCVHRYVCVCVYECMSIMCVWEWVCVLYMCERQRKQKKFSSLSLVPTPDTHCFAKSV